MHEKYLIPGCPKDIVQEETCMFWICIHGFNFMRANTNSMTKGIMLTAGIQGLLAIKLCHMMLNMLTI